MAEEVLQVLMVLTALMSLAFLCFIAVIISFGIWLLKHVGTPQQYKLEIFKCLLNIFSLYQFYLSTTLRDNKVNVIPLTCSCLIVKTTLISPFSCDDVSYLSLQLLGRPHRSVFNMGHISCPVQPSGKKKLGHHYSRCLAVKKLVTSVRFTFKLLVIAIFMQKAWL